MTTRKDVLLRSAAGLLAASILGLGVASLRGGDAAGPQGAPALARADRDEREARSEARPTRAETPVSFATTDAVHVLPARLEASPGDVFRYRLDARWVGRIEKSPEGDELTSKLGDGLPSRMTTRFRGTLEVAVLAREEREYLLRFTVRDPAATVDLGASVQRFDADALARAVHVRFADDGRVLAYAFEPGVSEHAQTLLVGAFALSHQFVVRDQSTPWTVSGLRDDLGSFSARFGWADSSGGGAPTLKRTVLSYHPGSVQSVERSAAQARIAAGWIASAEANEERRAHVEGLFDSRTSVSVRIELAERSTAAVDPSSATAQRAWQTGPIDTAVPATEGDDGAAERMAEIDDPEAALEETVAELAAIATTDALHGPAGFEAWRRLADLAHAFPEQVVPLMVDLLRSGELDPASRNWLLSALGKAGGDGSRAATAALTELIADASLSDDLRMSALIAAHQLGGNVTPEVIEATTDVLLLDDGGDSPLPTTAALLLGDFAGQSGHGDGTAALIDAGLDLVRETAFERGEPSVYFEALRNSGRPELLALGFDDLGHADPAVRRAAVDALAGLPEEPRTLDALVRTATHDESALVRGAALDSIADLPATPQTAAFLGDVARSDPDSSVRADAVRALGSQALSGSPDAQAALENLAREPGTVGDLARSALDDLTAPTA